MRDSSEHTERRRKRKLAFLFVLLGALGVSGLSLVFPGMRDQIRTQVLGATAKKPDTTPPTVAIAFPAAGGVYGPATWTGSVRGSASDATGVKTVEVKLGSGSWVLASETTSWSSLLSLPAAEGSYTVYARATDTVTPAANANTSSPVSVTFRVDHTAPAAPPVFTKTPDDPTFETKAQFNYQAEAGATFECVLDGAPPVACDPSGIEYKNLQPGTHTFTVVAIDAAGNRSGPGTFTWTILVNRSFGISGGPAGPLAPGVTQPLSLRLTNPYNFSIQVLEVHVTATVSDVPPTDCTLAVAHLELHDLTDPVDIPANSSVTLSRDPWPTTGWPTIKMANADENQDACKSTTFTLSYTGTATKS